MIDPTAVGVWEGLAEGAFLCGVALLLFALAAIVYELWY